MTVKEHSGSSGSTPIPAIDIPQSLVKSLHMPLDQLLLLRPLLVCHVSRFAPGVINSWLPRALLVTETGQLLLFDTHDGRVTHETSLRLDKPPMAEDGMPRSEEDKRLVHVVFENQMEKAITTTMWLKIAVTDSVFAAVLRFQEPFSGMPATLLRVILRFVPERLVSIQKCAKEGPLVKFISKEFCSISSIKSGNSSPPRRSGVLTPRSSAKHYMTEVVRQELQRQSVFKSEMTEAQNALAEGSKDRDEDKVSDILPLTAEEVVPPQPLVVSALADNEDTVPTSENADENEEEGEESEEEEEESEEEEEASEEKQQDSDDTEDVIPPQEEVNEEGCDASEEEGEGQKKSLDMPQKDDVVFSYGNDKERSERKERNADTFVFHNLAKVVSSTPEGRESEVEREVSQEQVSREDMWKKNHTSHQYESKEKHVKLVTADITKDEQIELSPNDDARCSFDATPLQRATPTSAPLSIPSGKIIKEMVPYILSLENTEENESHIVHNSSFALDGSQQTSSTSLKKMDNVETIMNDEVLSHSLNKQDEKVSSILYISTSGGGTALTQNSVNVALRANGIHILSTYPLQRPTTDYTNEATGSTETKQHWQQVYNDNLGRKSEPRVSKRAPTGTFTRTIIS
ncbi:uncharacterized protein TM35_000152630 [Trypanosoma theileri]|uniref:Uncharacterized protein n=1 Tax=Trypanosoma theileri TaxID=67003 RepID=A0A1X0NVX7_9TRYP|nr:uncharacterized protein TM35_000152630 [Trypanosoma theileri]ORC88832.1 hypothetical protein TM35_000152630 [Trypanosoma theileri]